MYLQNGMKRIPRKLDSEKPEKNQPKYVTIGLFDTLFDDHIEYKHCINNILKKFSVSEDVLNEQQETSKCETSCKESNHWKTKLTES